MGAEPGSNSPFAYLSAGHRGWMADSRQGVAVIIDFTDDYKLKLIIPI